MDFDAEFLMPDTIPGKHKLSSGLLPASDTDTSTHGQRCWDLGAVGMAGDAGCGAGVPPVLAGPWLLQCFLTVDGDKKGKQAALPGQKGCVACSWQ